MALSERMDAGESAFGRAQADPELVEGSKGKTPAPAACFVYILHCSDGSYYVGSTTDLSGREQAHNEGHGSEYTSGRRPVRIVYSEAHRSWPAARKREVQIKRWSHAKKQALVDEHLDRLHRLARRRHY